MSSGSWTVVPKKPSPQQGFIWEAGAALRLSLVPQVHGVGWLHAAYTFGFRIETKWFSRLLKSKSQRFDTETMKCPLRNEFQGVNKFLYTKAYERKCFLGTDSY